MQAAGEADTRRSSLHLHLHRHRHRRCPIFNLWVAGVAGAAAAPTTAY